MSHVEEFHNVFLFHVGKETWMLLQNCWQNKFVFKLLLDPFNLSVIHADSLMSRCQRCVFVADPLPTRPYTKRGPRLTISW